MFKLSYSYNIAIVYAIYIKRKYRERHTKTLFLYFLYNFEILISLLSIIY